MSTLFAFVVFENMDIKDFAYRRAELAANGATGKASQNGPRDGSDSGTWKPNGKASCSTNLGASKCANNTFSRASSGTNRADGFASPVTGYNMNALAKRTMKGWRHGRSLNTLELA
jgi:hypothetical protein